MQIRPTWSWSKYFWITSLLFTVVLCGLAFSGRKPYRVVLSGRWQPAAERVYNVRYSNFRVDYVFDPEIAQVPFDPYYKDVKDSFLINLSAVLHNNDRILFRLYVQDSDVWVETATEDPVILNQVRANLSQQRLKNPYLATIVGQLLADKMLALASEPKSII